MMRTTTITTLVSASLLLALASGCSNVPNGDLAAVQPISSAPRAGNVYLVRGWIGVFSTGIDALSEKVNAAGVRGLVYQDGQWLSLANAIAEKYRGVKDPEPLVLVGHSYGADDVVAIARELDHSNVAVDLLVTIDPTTPPAVPKNVRRCYNLYQPSPLDVLPVLRGIALTPAPDFKGKLENVNIRADRTDLLEGEVNHFNIEKKDTIHREAIKQILSTCPPRPVWAAAHRTLPPAASAAPIMAAHNPGAALPRLATTRPAAPPRTPAAAITSTADNDDRFVRD